MTLMTCLTLNRSQISWGALLRLLERLEQHNPGSCQHARGVARFTRLLAKQLGLPKEVIFSYYVAGLLHDVGKLGVPENVLNNPGPLLDPRDVAAVQSHVVTGRAILAEFPALFPILDGPYLHHERWDGTGYPLGLKGRNIPLPARIIAVADVYYAMIRPRPYREAFDTSAVLKHLWARAGNHFDPLLVLAFTQVLGETMPAQERGNRTCDGK